MLPFLVIDLICIMVVMVVWCVVVTFNTSSNIEVRLSLLVGVVFMGK
jgi:hypothetical protein